MKLTIRQESENEYLVTVNSESVEKSKTLPYNRKWFENRAKFRKFWE